MEENNAHLPEELKILEKYGIELSGQTCIGSDIYEIYMRKITDFKVCRVCKLEYKLNEFQPYGTDKKLRSNVCDGCVRIRLRENARKRKTRKTKKI